jgi:hypothetical protein
MTLLHLTSFPILTTNTSITITLLLPLPLLSQSNKGVATPVTDAPRLLLLTLPAISSDDVQQLEDTLKQILTAALQYASSKTTSATASTTSTSTNSSGITKGLGGGRGVSPRAGAGGTGGKTRHDTARQKEQKDAFRDLLRYTTIHDMYFMNLITTLCMYSWY